MKTTYEASGTTLNAPTFIVQGSQKEKREKLFEERIAENFPNRTENSQPGPVGAEPQQAYPRQNIPQQVYPRQDNPKEEYIVIKLTKIKNKDKILKATREKWQITYKGTPIRLSADFLIETLQARRRWHDIFKVIKGKNLQPRYSTQQEIKNFPDRQKLREFSTTEPTLQQMLKELHQIETQEKEKTYIK